MSQPNDEINSDSTENSDSEMIESTNPPPLMGLTENCSPTFIATGNPCLDFFFHILPDTPQDQLIQRLDLSWKHNPLLSLKLIGHLRGVRGTGKSDKESFYVAAMWLYQHHPKTLSMNVKWFAEFGYLKDLMEILYRILEGNDVRKREKKERDESGLYWKKGKRCVRTQSVVIWRKGERVTVERSLFKKSAKKSKKSKQDLIVDEVNKLSLEEKKKEEMEEEKEDMEEESEEKTSAKAAPRKKNAGDLAKKALERYTSDPNYRFLHDKISDLFAELLSSDVKFLESKQYGKISLAAKWCPSLDSSYDKSTLICENIAKKVFPRESNQQYAEIDETRYAYIVRNRLRKEVLSPLRGALELPEIYMSAKKWDSLPYERVASVAMKLLKKLFVEHDLERFTAHLENVKTGKAKIAAGALLPHEILKSLDEEDGEQVKDVAELQWKRMVEDLSAKGTLTNCLAVCDVSGSMGGLPMEVCVALGILISELSEHPWKGKLITFSHSPTLQTVTGDTLTEKKQFVETMDWGTNTDFQKVFDLILAVAVKGKLRESDMVKRVFVFSDMEFDEASSNDWETDYEAIKRKFKESGYESAVPEIVFWNLRNSSATPVAATQNGVALVSGYSKNLLTLFLKGEDALNPEVIMESAISGPEYEKLTVYD
ncbi:hypothetical protein ACHQM5_006410 [Ranunculus cassubicifolius]